jgi:hypothetical protein
MRKQCKKPPFQGASLIRKIATVLRASALGDGIRGADIGACAAGNAGVSVDLVLICAFGNRADRALGLAGSALDACVGNLVCHGLIHLLSWFNGSNTVLFYHLHISL